jgi:CheY-like chemotaxis protein
MHTVLIIKDDDVITTLFKHALEEDGLYEVLLARNGKEAYQHIKNKRPAIILTDVYLPGKCGADVLADIKRDPEMTDVPAIIFIAEKEAEVVLNTLEGNSDLHMPKPINLERLKFHIRELVPAIED